MPAQTYQPMNDPNLSSFIWSVADLLRGDYKQSEYGKVILPFTVLRRLDCVLEATKPAVLHELATREKAGLNPEPFLLRKSGQLFFNTSPLDMKKLLGDQDHVKENLFAYMQAFSPAVRDIFESFDFHTQIDRLAKSGLLYLVAEKFANIDLHPKAVSNAQMGAVFEELIRKFAELSIWPSGGCCSAITTGRNRPLATCTGSRSIASGNGKRRRSATRNGSCGPVGGRRVHGGPTCLSSPKANNCSRTTG
jgi:HsdM N-terminal domain